ncbi:helix-turn-helix domain-containing protein [Methylomonas rapida]|uniref:Helix-turn-helix transcriptional regulator n=1 Tax=Methylomonas rapida TaxID=2963939 RepID=A0ABY7GK30_9GAMM|nr:helix-turn-helix transcriptional regulator [Methylomonas rapida]WAR43528.1 helix-turn-helix transcriptional regulator [Methylomonas rapida]
MRDSLEAKLEVAGFLERIINRSTYSQKEIAEMCGFNTPNIITMLKQGSTKVPVEKIPALAKALDIDRVEFFELVMKNYRPKEYEVIVEIFGEPISDAERAIIKLLRQVIPAGQLVNNTNHYRNKIREALEN